MQDYEFTGVVYYRDAQQPYELRTLETRVIVTAPTMQVARAVLNNYGMSVADRPPKIVQVQSI